MRQLLVGPELIRLDQIERRRPPAPSPENVGDVLPEAVSHASQVHRETLATAIEKPITTALRDVARREPELFGEILAPTIGTAVRRAVADAIAAMLQRMNALLERGLSLRSWIWRIEAKRTGRPFAEVVLAHTLVYRVEWAVLIHSPTSLVLEQAALPGAPQQAPDQISAMLSAISSFVSDAFQPAIPGADLNTLEVGDLTLWIERDPALTLAVAIRGIAPLRLRTVIRDTLDRIRTLHADELKEPHPNIAAFGDAHPLLVDCLQQQFRPTPKRAQWFLGILVTVIAILVAVMLLRGCDREQRDVDLRAGYSSALSSVPGFVITSIERDGDAYRIKGLRDPRAEAPDQVIERAGLPPAALELAPYDSLDPRFHASLFAADEAIRELETIEIPFERGRTVVSATDPAIDRAAQLVNRAQRAAAQSHVGLCVEIIGGADETGTVGINNVIRSARAANVARALTLAGVSPDLLDPRVVDAIQAPPLRRVTFRGALRSDPERTSCSG